MVVFMVKNNFADVIKDLRMEKIILVYPSGAITQGSKKDRDRKIRGKVNSSDEGSTMLA
jgi:hypothetical protein